MDLKTYIWQHRLTKVQVAKELFLSWTYVGGLCSGKFQPSIGLAKKIIDWSEGEIAPYDLFPDLFECYKETLEKKALAEKSQEIL